jgi:hypothetical protein
MLPKMVRATFLEDQPNGCPGLAKGRFFGGEKIAFAALLTRKRGSGRELVLLYARKERDSGPWEVGVIDGPWTATTADVPVLDTSPPDKYESIEGNVTVVAIGDVVHLVYYWSSEIAYVWADERFYPVYLRD